MLKIFFSWLLLVKLGFLLCIVFGNVAHILRRLLTAIVDANQRFKNVVSFVNSIAALGMSFAKVWDT